MKFPYLEHVTQVINMKNLITYILLLLSTVSLQAQLEFEEAAICCKSQDPLVTENCQNGLPILIYSFVDPSLNYFEFFDFEAAGIDNWCPLCCEGQGDDGGGLGGVTAEESVEIVGFASGAQLVNSTIQSRNSSISRQGLGRYTVTFNSQHPDGLNYEIVFGQAESGTLRDVPKVSMVTGTKTANGFQVQITYDDNGGTADVYVDDEWSFFVPYEITLLKPQSSQN